MNHMSKIVAYRTASSRQSQKSSLQKETVKLSSIILNHHSAEFFNQILKVSRVDRVSELRWRTNNLWSWSFYGFKSVWLESPKRIRSKISVPNQENNAALSRKKINAISNFTKQWKPAIREHFPSPKNSKKHEKKAKTLEQQDCLDDEGYPLSLTFFLLPFRYDDPAPLNLILRHIVLTLCYYLHRCARHCVRFLRYSYRSAYYSWDQISMVRFKVLNHPSLWSW